MDNTTTTTTTGLPFTYYYWQTPYLPWSAQCPHCNPKCAHGYPVSPTPYQPTITYTYGNGTTTGKVTT